ncbi:fimbrial protein [Pseudomonas spelaei]|nr:fimbrial protein [Pseudomonas spelaei]
MTIGVTGLLICVQATAGELIFPWSKTTTQPFTKSTLIVPQQHSVGTILDDAGLNVGLELIDVDCAMQRTTVINNGVLVPGYTDVYQTGVSGIGVKYTQTQGYGSGTWDTVPISYSLAAPLSPSKLFGSFVRAQLVITGEIGSGTITSVPTMTQTWSGACITPSAVGATFNFPVNATVEASSCRVTTPALHVTLPDTELHEIQPLGTTKGNTTFNIGLECQSGSSVYITLSDANNPNNRTDNLTLNSSSTARGIALRILNSDGKAVSFGPESSVAGNPNQWLVGPSSDTSNVPLTVQYVSVRSPLTAGSVSAEATFTMSYQ